MEVLGLPKDRSQGGVTKWGPPKRQGLEIAMGDGDCESGSQESERGIPLCPGEHFKIS